MGKVFMKELEPLALVGEYVVIDTGPQVKKLKVEWFSPFEQEVDFAEETTIPAGGSVGQVGAQGYGDESDEIPFLQPTDWTEFVQARLMIKDDITIIPVRRQGRALRIPNDESWEFRKTTPPEKTEVYGVYKPELLFYIKNETEYEINLARTVFNGYYYRVSEVKKIPEGIQPPVVPLKG